MSSAKEKFVIFDGNAIVHRAWHALPPLTTKNGVLVNAVYGFTNMFLKVLKDIKPQYVAVAFDRREPTFRHKVFKDYKAQRVKQPQELYDQIPLIKEILQVFHVPIFEAAGFEADDVIGTLTLKVELESPKVENVIVTGDLDTLQLVGEKTNVYLPKKGLSDPVLYNEAAVLARFGISPSQLVEYKTLRGDPSDNIPGVKGIGEKTALALIKKYDSVAAIYAVLAKSSSRSIDLSAHISEALRAAREEIELSRQLVAIVRDVPLKFKLANCRLEAFDTKRLVELFHQLEFKSLLARLPELQTKLNLKATTTPTKGSARDSTSYHLVTTENEFKKMVAAVRQQRFIVIDTETTSLNPLQAQLVGVSLSYRPGEAYFVVFNESLWSGSAGQEFKAILANSKVGKGGHNLKYDWQILRRAGLTVNNLAFDTLVAAYLKQAGERSLDLKTLVFQELGVQLKSITELIGAKGKGQKNMAEVPLAEVADYACADADYTGRLITQFKMTLKQNELWGLFQEIEMPLVPILGQMELVGIKIDAVYLKTLANKLTAQIDTLEKSIYKLSGHKFNINSPKQLKEILFDKLKIPSQGLRRSKTGISTAAAELEKMRALHPVIDELFHYRELTKLLSTYVEALPKLIDANTGRVHTSFNQAVTATGRLSSSEPNLQNIPIRSEWGQPIRRAFVAESGYKILSADYSQIELRLAAHLSGDAKMIKVFKQGKDIHNATAAFIFNAASNQVTPEQRRRAKEVNFGILYGMGPWGLAERTGIERNEAKEFIDRYFKTFPKLAEWIERTKAEARRQGYVVTLLARRRYLPEINSGVAQVRAQAERMAVNLPVQGSSADLMKIAMIRISNKLPAHSPTTRMLLQVHDELVFEVPAAAVAKVARFVKTEMEQAIKLSVPIVVDVKAGDNWGEMEPVVLSS